MATRPTHAVSLEWKALCRDFFTGLQKEWPNLTRPGFPQLLYPPRGNYWIATVSGYGMRPLFYVTVATRDPEDLRARNLEPYSYLSVGLLFPRDRAADFPKTYLEKRFKECGIDEPLDYGPQKVKPGQPKSAQANYHAGVRHPDGGDIRASGRWPIYDQWAAETAVKMKTVVDEVRAQLMRRP